MRTYNPNYRQVVQDIFESAPYIQSLGIRLVDLGVGWVESEMVIRPNHLQHSGLVHAGVQATLADHSAGAAAATLVAPNTNVLTIEFKINLLRPAAGEKLTCRSNVLKAGRMITIVESTVSAHANQKMLLVSKATITIANVTT